MLRIIFFVLSLVLISGCVLNNPEPPTRLQRADPTFNTHPDLSKSIFFKNVKYFAKQIL